MGLNVVSDAVSNISGIAGGLFGGGGQGSGTRQANGELDADIARNEAELEQKRQSLFQQRLDVLKSNGMENWNPTRSITGSPVAPAKARNTDNIFVEADRSAAEGMIKSLR